MAVSPKASLSLSVIAQAESFDGIRAGIIRLEDLLKGPSHQAAARNPGTATALDDEKSVDWLEEAHTVLILGLQHPEKDLRLDYWEKGDSWGNRRLREISELLKKWLQKEYGLAAHPLPYHVEKGGLFLKDAAVLSGLGIIGRNNMLLNPEWGPRIRLRSILLAGEFQPTPALDGFAPCDRCDDYCQKACPVDAFPQGLYRRSICWHQINTDVENKAPTGDIGADGKRNQVIQYCRACELSCPVGASSIP